MTAFVKVRLVTSQKNIETIAVVLDMYLGKCCRTKVKENITFPAGSDRSAYILKATLSTSRFLSEIMR